MKTRAVAIAFIGWQGCVATVSLAFIPCHTVELSRQARERIAAAIGRLAPEPLDFRTLYACGWGRGASGVKQAWIDTRHADEADGSQRWRTANCWGDRTWECTLSGDHRSIEVSVSGYPPRLVEIPLDMPVDEARARVTQAYSLIPTLTVEHFRSDTGRDQVAREIFEIKQLAAQDDFHLQLSKVTGKDGVDRHDLAIGQYTLGLERAAAEDSLRISGVREAELVE